MLTRVLQARRWRVFKAWTNEHLLAAWCAPEGFVNTVCALDVTRGGAIYIIIKGPGSTVHTIKGNYREIDEPELLSFTSATSYDVDETAKLKILNTVIFIEEGYNTRITLQAVVMRSAKGTENVTDRLKAGWSEGLDRLERLLMRLKFNCSATYNHKKTDERNTTR